MTMTDILDKWKHIIAERFDSMFGEYDSMYDLCYPEQEQQLPAPPPTVHNQMKCVLPIHSCISYLKDVKVYESALGAECQELYDICCEHFCEFVDKNKNNFQKTFSENFKIKK